MVIVLLVVVSLAIYGAISDKDMRVDILMIIYSGFCGPLVEEVYKMLEPIKSMMLKGFLLFVTILLFINLGGTIFCEYFVECT